MINIGVVGSRRRDSQNDYLSLLGEISYHIRIYGIENITLVSGGCKKGADRFAELIHHRLKFPTPMIIHYPDICNETYLAMKTKNNRAAYAIIAYARNTLIARDSDELIALVASDRKGGTEDTIKKFIKMKNKKPILL